MKALTRIAVAALAAALPVAAAYTQAPQTAAAIDEFAHLQNDLRANHAGNNTAAYLKGSQDLYAFLNGSPRAALQLASAQATAGHLDDALNALSEFAGMGQASEDTLKTKAFDPLRTLPRYSSIHLAMSANTAPVTTAEQAFRLTELARLPEDVDYDSSRKLFFISTVLGQQILQFDLAGHGKVFADSPDHWPMMALKIDPRRNLLWVTQVAFDGFASAAKPDWGRCVVLVYDLHSGKLLHRVEGPAKTALGDMVLDSNGDAIISDGERGGIYRISGTTFTLQRIDAGDFISPQTAAIFPDSKQIFVPDYVRGIGVLDPDSKAVRWLPMAGMHALSGIDGLYAVGNSLIATQNGTSPERVVQFTLNAAKTAVVSEHIIERSTPTLGDPTHGVVIGAYFYYIADSGWNVVDDHGAVLTGKTLPVSTVRRAKIT